MELQLCFPEKFNDAGIKNFAAQIKAKILAECNYILSDGDEKYLGAVKEITNHFLKLSKPKNLDGDSNDNVVVQFDVQFSELCIAVMTSGAPDPENMTVLKFYSALKYFEAKLDKQRNKNESHRNGTTVHRGKGTR